MARRRKKIVDEDLLDDEIDEPVRTRRPPRRRRWKFLLVLLGLVGVAIGAPAIVSKTPLRNVLLTSALPGSTGRLTATDANFSWTGGQTMLGVNQVDAAGAPLLSAESITLNRSLIGLASNSSNLGKVTITRPVIHLDEHDGTSNLEDFLQRLADAARQRAAKPGGGPPAQTTIEVEIIDGIVMGRDYGSGQQWRIDGLAATATPIAQSESWDVAATGVLSLAATAPAVPIATLAASQRLAGEAPTNFPSGADQPGRFKIHLHPVDAGDGDAPARQEIEVMADRLPLSPIEPWLARLLPQARLTGDASADLHLAWSPAAPGSARGLNDQAASIADGGLPPGGAGGYTGANVTATGKLDATNLRFTAAALSGDLVELPAAAIALDATIAGDRLAARQCSAKCDWLQAELNGDFNLAELNRLNFKSLPTSDGVVTVKASLPELTRMLPRTLQLRPGVRVDAGKMEITARSAKGEGGRHWTVAAAVEDLVGSDGARPIRWTKPVELVFDAAEAPTGPQLQRAIFHSAFATADVDGAAGGFQGKVQFNLDELAAQVGQFVDLSAWQLHGAGDGQFSWRDTGPEQFAASAELNLKQIDVQRAGKVVWQDPQVQVEARANGSRQSLKPQRLDAASFTMRGGPADTLTAELVEPIDLSDFSKTWLIKLSGNGPLELWAGRLRPWVAGIPEQLAGQTTLAAQVRARQGLLQVSESKLSVVNLQAKLGQGTIVEQRVEAAGDFRWDSRDQAIESQDLQFSSSTVAARARGLSVRLSDAGPPTVRGDVAFRGDLERVAAWGDVLGATPPGIRPRGQAVGQLKLASDPQRATANLAMTVTPFRLISPAPAEQSLWDEPNLEFATEAVYTNADDRLQLANIRLAGKTVQMTGAGVIDQFRTAGIVHGDVSVNYDAAELAKLLTAYLGPNVQFQGANTARLQAAGRLRSSAPGSAGGLTGVMREVSTETTWNSSATPPPGGAGGNSGSWSRNWQLTTETGWSAANFYGLPVGAARLTANLRDGELQFTPLDLAVGQGGRISLQPRVFLDPPPQRLALAPGQVITNVAISQEVSERMLKYAAPVVAGATRAEGAFSFFLESADIPLRQPKEGRLKGRLTIHRLAVLPGPMIQEVATLIRQVDALGKNAQGAGQGPLGLGGLLGGAAQPAQPIKGITMTERAIDVQVADGRVYHNNLEFLIDDVPVRSQGSVGFDETLSLMIQVPVQAKWVGSKPALKQLVGQVIQIPVGGTLSKPQIDNRALGQFAGQAAQAAATGVIGEELNKAFDKIFKPK